MSILDELPPQKMALSDVESAAMIELLDSYWQDFGKLVGRYVNDVPPHLIILALARMQEKSTVYGSDFERYLPDMVNADVQDVVIKTKQGKAP